MDRRSLLQAGAAAVAVTGFAGTAFSQVAKRKIAISSRHLQWLRAPDEVAHACIEMAFDGLDITVASALGHVDPARVKTDLPAFVTAIRNRGLTVDTITCAMTDADSPNAETVLEAAAALGIKHYVWEGLRYDLTKPITPQLDALKPRLAKLAKLNEKYGVKAMYRNRSGADNVGAAIFDLLEVFKGFDPRSVSFQYDTGEAAMGGGNDTWALGLRAAAPYIGGIAFTDGILKYQLPVDEGGPFKGTPEQLNAHGQGRFAGSPVPPPPELLAVNRGGGGKTNPWVALPVPLGTGLVDLPQTGRILKEIGFQGPIEIGANYPNGGAETGTDKITLLPALVLGAMKRDLLTLKAGFGLAGFA